MSRNDTKLCKHCGLRHFWHCFIYLSSHWEFEQNFCAFIDGNQDPCGFKCASQLYRYVTVGSLRTSSELELVPRTTLQFYMLGNIPLLLSQQYFPSFMYLWSPTQADRFTFMHLAVVFIQSSRRCIQGIHFIISCIPWKSNPWLWHC